MNFFSPGIALLKPMRGTMRFWVLPLPLLLTMVIMLVTHAFEIGSKGDRGTWLG